MYYDNLISKEEYYNMINKFKSDTAEYARGAGLVPGVVLD
jgi:hypothetical protein